MTHNQPDAVSSTFIRPVQFGAGALVLLLVVYFGVVDLISGLNFAFEQFAIFWYFIIPLALGFGILVGLFIYLKNLVLGLAFNVVGILYVASKVIEATKEHKKCLTNS